MQTIHVEDINNPLPQDPTQNPVPQPGSHIIKMDLNTKVLYSLFNFFSPIALGTFLFFNGVTEHGSEGDGAFSALFFLLLVCSVVVGFVCFLVKLFKYNRFFYVQDNCIYLCKGKPNAPRVLDTLPVADIDKKLGAAPVVVHQNKKKKLLYPSLSWVGKICWLGPLLIIFIGHEQMIARRKMSELYALLPQLFEKAPKNPGSTEYVLMQIAMWGLVVLMSLFGIAGLLLTLYLLFSIALVG